MPPGKPRVPVPTRPSGERVRDFEGVVLGYTPGMAREEASRCLQCRKPACEEGCPVRVPIREVLRLVAEGDLEGASRSLRRANALPAVCGRVCPQEKQCEASCLLGRKGEPVAIGEIERLLGEPAGPGEPAEGRRPPPV